jgi:hypothetical protein
VQALSHARRNDRNGLSVPVEDVADDDAPRLLHRRGPLALALDERGKVRQHLEWERARLAVLRVLDAEDPGLEVDVAPFEREHLAPAPAGPVQERHSTGTGTRGDRASSSDPKPQRIGNPLRADGRRRMDSQARRAILRSLAAMLGSERRSRQRSRSHCSLVSPLVVPEPVTVKQLPRTSSVSAPSAQRLRTIAHVALRS